MKMMKKTALFLVIAIMMCTLICVNASAETSANSDSGFYRMMLLMAYDGGTDQTLNRTKVIANSFVDVEELMIATYNTEGIYLRVRDGSTGAYATAAGNLHTYDSWWRPTYNSGYGVTGHTYYVKGQTPSGSMYSAAVDAYWCP